MRKDFEEQTEKLIIWLELNTPNTEERQRIIQIVRECERQFKQKGYLYNVQMSIQMFADYCKAYPFRWKDFSGRKEEKK